MGRVQQVMLAAAALAAGNGCAATDRFSAGYLDARRAVGLDPAGLRPASEVSLLCEKRLQTLPDPVRPDTQQAGLPAQLFVTAADGKPTTVSGPVVVTVFDQTPRPAGQPAKTPEKWEFTPDVLSKLRATQGQLGPCYVLFLPWPKGWEDVTRVGVHGQYKGADGPILHTRPARVALDQTGGETTGGGWAKTDNFAVPLPQGLRPGETPPAAFALPPPPLQPGGPILLPSPSSGPMIVPAPAVSPPPATGGPVTITIPRS